MGRLLAAVVPVVGHAIAAEPLGIVLSNVAASAVIASVVGRRIGMAIPENEARNYETERKSGRTLVTVSSDNRQGEAFQILTRHGGRTKPLAGNNAP